ncbi:DUF298-domain-containing protein [Coniochaeta ligniaria NRRL 30616]|uniref:Defective in cullin neddylation protein n=1 Tax=Coniochaeta ligniaria NRRL 30616 TaxID=1408157 RepID=A0A1J7I507_9PEZI|nr:DUF298-domain-containing protein [Coniochaeta ligniaria NRRL 30616]
MPLTASQKTAVQTFVTTTGASEKIAQRYLKNSGFRLDAAVNQYFESNGISIPSPQPSASSKRDDAKLDQMFDDMRDPEKDAKDEIGVESLMKYFAVLGVNPETCEIFVVLDIVQATSFGLITRKGFVDGWKATGVPPSISAHKKHIKDLTKSLSTDVSYFKKVYRAAFTAGKEPDQKALGLDHAVVYWDMVFSPPGMAWETATTDWLAEWKEFLGEKWTRSVNKDMWNQTLEFALKSMEDESLGFWSEDAAWPGVIDEFVMWCRENKRGGVMEVDS